MTHRTASAIFAPPSTKAATGTAVFVAFPSQLLYWAEPFLFKKWGWNSYHIPDIFLFLVRCKSNGNNNSNSIPVIPSVVNIKIIKGSSYVPKQAKSSWDLFFHHEGCGSIKFWVTAQVKTPVLLNSLKWKKICFDQTWKDRYKERKYNIAMKRGYLMAKSFIKIYHSQTG